MRKVYIIVANTATHCEVSCGLRAAHNIGKFGGMPALADSDEDDDGFPLNPERGARIRLRRKQLGLTQKTLAEMVGKAEYSVSRWEKGRRVADIVKLAQALQVSPIWLESGGADPAPAQPARSPVAAWIELVPEGSTVTAEERVWLESVPLPVQRPLDPEGLATFYRQLLVAHRALPRRRAGRGAAFLRYLDEHPDAKELWEQMVRFSRGDEDEDE